MKVLLLAAGMGTRLRPITNSIPKCLVPIQGMPLLGHWLALIKKVPDLSEVYVNCHYLADQVIKYLESIDSFPCPVTVLAEQELLGTAGTLCHPEIKLNNEPMMIIHADNLSMFDLHDFIDSHLNRPKQCVMTMMLFKTDSPKSCGIVSLDRNNIVTEMHEKVAEPPGNMANGAVYIFEPTVIHHIRQKKFEDISLQVIPKYMGAIFSWFNDGYHRDIGTVASYDTAQHEYSEFLKKYRTNI